MINLEELKEKFNNHIGFKEKRPGLLQIFFPLYHEDGDMYEIFIEEDPHENKLIICDYGLTLMKLSYDYEIDTPKKEEILNKILNQNALDFDENKGNIYIKSDIENIYSSFMQFTQGVSKIASMQYFKREVIKDLFYENLKDFIYESYKKYNPTEKFYPLENQTEYEVDYNFDVKPYPVYLFAIKEASKAKNTAISCRQFIIKNINFKSIVVYEDIDNIPRNDYKRVTSAVDKQFISLQDFKENSSPYLLKQIAA